MSRKYYYFIASLPLLEFEGKLLISAADFLNDSKRILVEKDFIVIQELLNNSISDSSLANDFVKKWSDFLHLLNNEMAAFRAERWGKNPVDFVKGERKKDPYFISLLNQAAEAINPLEAEKVLDKAKWLFLDEISFGHYFDFEGVIAYAIKLQILSRYAKYNSEEYKPLYSEYESSAKEEKQYELSA